MKDFGEHVILQISELKKYEKNSRTHSKKQISQIVNSIKEFGFTNPLLIDENNQIIAGHGRLEAALKCKMTRIPCIILKDLSESQKRALVIADNKIALNSDWDLTLLKSELEELKLDDFDLSLTGFENDELSELFDEESIEYNMEEEHIPEVQEFTCKEGDLWLLGEHRLICGDSTNPEIVKILLNFDKPNIMITDPPYGINLDMSWRDEAKKDGANNNKNIVKNDDKAEWSETYKLFSGNICYVWHASIFSDIVMNDLRECGFEIKQQIIWNKNHLVLSRSNYHWKHEPCWYAIRKGKNSEWKADRKQTTVWDCGIPNISGSNTDDKTIHPTQKPIELFVTSILNHTNKNEYVYDPFAGSGTIMMACEKTNRKALMIELDPKYCDVIIKRYENHTGNKAILSDNK